jgi:hypothetical protein
MDKYLIRSPSSASAKEAQTKEPQIQESFKSTFDMLKDSDISEPTITPGCRLGFLGNSSASYWNANTITDIVNPLLSEINTMPTEVNLPTDGITSLLLQVWAEKQKIPCQAIDADWIRLGRRARAMRDSRIIKDSTHLVFFVGSKSDYYEKIAIREAKKGKIVFTVDAKTKELVQWVL